MCATWIVRMYGVTQTHANTSRWRGHDSCMCATFVVHMCDMTQTHANTSRWRGDDSCMCATWIVHMCDMTQTHANTHTPIRLHRSSRRIGHDSCINIGRWSAHELVQGGEDSQDALRCRSFFAKEPLIIGLFCGIGPVKIRQSMTLRHPIGSWYVHKYIDIAHATKHLENKK